MVLPISIWRNTTKAWKVDSRVESHTHTNKDCIGRQVREGVLIRRSNKQMMNSKSEWFQPPIYRIRSEVIRE